MLDFRLCIFLLLSKAKLLTEVEIIIRRMRWKAYFFLHLATDPSPRQTYAFKTRKCPPQVEELKPFENDLFKRVENARFRRINDQFLNTFKNGINNIKTSNKVVIPADKTRNMYKMDKDVYTINFWVKILQKSYKKADEQHLWEINSEWRQISTELNTADRMEITAEKQHILREKITRTTS